MKLVLYILLLIFFITPFIGFGQNPTEVIKINYKATDHLLEKIFEDLEKRYDIRFSYSTESILTKRKNCDFQDIELDEVLEYLLDEEKLEYKIVGQNILLRKQDDFLNEENEQYKSALHLRGKLVFSDTEEALSYASIVVQGSAIGTFTDNEGHFDLEIPARHLKDSLIFHSLGLEDRVYAIQDLGSEFLLIALEEGEIKVDEIVIVNRKKKIKIFDDVGAIGLDLKSKLKSGMLNGDLTKQLQKLAGVDASDDQSSEIKIRGSQAEETLIILDGMPIYNCSHYYGIFNSINHKYIDELKLYKSYFPLEYGGKTGGIVELESANESISENYLDVGLDLMSVSGLAKWKVSDKIDFRIAGRSTTTDITNTQFNTLSSIENENSSQEQSFSVPVKENRSEPSFNFYDVNAKLFWQPNERQSFSLNAFLSNDLLNNTFITNIKDPSNNELKLDAKETELWDNKCFSFRHDIIFKNHWKIETTNYFSNYSNEGIIEYDIKKPPPMQGDPPPNKFTLGIDQQNEISDIGLKSMLHIPISKSIINIGGEYIQHNVFYELKENNDLKLKGDQQFSDISGFVGLDLNPISGLMIKSGLRSTYYEGTKNTYLSPRFLINYQLSNSIRLKSSFGNYQQFIRQFPFEYRGESRNLWVSSGRNDIPILKSQNIMLGINSVFSHLSLDVEFYRKNFEGLTEYSILQPGQGNSESAPGPRDYELFKGNGITRGVDVTVSSGYKNYDTYVTYTLSESKERFKEIAMNEFFASQEDRRHQLKWVNIIAWKKLQFGLDWIFLSGKPYTDLQNLGSNGDIRNINQRDRFKRLKAYNRLDFSINYSFKIRKVNSNVSFAVLNLLDRQNAKYIQNVSEEVNVNSMPLNVVVGSESALLNRTFNIAWNISFGEI